MGLFERNKPLNEERLNLPLKPKINILYPCEKFFCDRGFFRGFCDFSKYNIYCCELNENSTDISSPEQQGETH